jgi:LCP family protein required for cell wall assembly
MGKRRRSRLYKSRRRGRAIRKALLTIGAVTVILAGAGLAVHSSLFSTSSDAVDRVETLTDTGQAEETGERKWVPKTPTTHTSILLMGLDRHGMSDLIMIISYDMISFESSLISIQRDTFVSGQTWASKNSGQDHLAWAHNRGMGTEKDFHAGARMAALTIEDLLGIDIHAYASVTFDGFVELVDYIGGVVIEVDPGFAEREGTRLPVGLKRLNGAQALIFARHRQDPRIPEPSSDSQAEDRVIRNQRLLKAIFDQCKSLETDQILAIADRFDNGLYTSLEDWDLLDLANILYNRDPEEIRTVTLPGSGDVVYQDRIEKETYYFFLDTGETDIILRELGLK